MADAKWYIAHTYSGYEDKVTDSLRMTILNRHLEDKIFKVKVPKEDVTEVKDGKKKTRKSKTFPGYVFVKMIMDDDTWYVIRNTRGVTGFVGPGSKPVPLSEAEVSSMGLERDDNEEIKPTEIKLDFAVGDTVRILEGSWADRTGVVRQINEHKQTVIIDIELFGRATPTELAFTAVKAEKY